MRQHRASLNLSDTPYAEVDEVQGCERLLARCDYIVQREGIKNLLRQLDAIVEQFKKETIEKKRIHVHS